MNVRSFKSLELNKILSAVSEYAVLAEGKEKVKTCLPTDNFGVAEKLLSCTDECDKLLYAYGIGRVEYFDDVRDAVERAAMGSALSCEELLKSAALLRSARIAHDGIASVGNGEIKIMSAMADNLYFDRGLENDIYEKIIPPDLLADSASDRLRAIRSQIKNLNAKIRAKLSEYLTEYSRYLQDAIVTIRNDRYVIPVKAEYKHSVRGFVHDRSQTGATFFIEPEQVLELNNELIALAIDEKEESEAILRALSLRVGAMRDRLFADMEILAEMDSFYARAEYCYVNKCSKPDINHRGYIKIIKGRHPLIDAKKIVPVTVELGDKYDFLLLSGANTGGKTVTLKLCGLFCLMAACGLFIPAASGSNIAVFDYVFCDIGDSQSIEDNLSTFSSHILNISEICSNANSNSLVLLDELGGGTNPEEGQALAKAIIKHLLSAGCKGIITTHFTALKEFAYNAERMENAGMEFDSDTFKPLYSIRIGLAGTSNALIIARRLGLGESILSDAENYLSDDERTLENIIRSAQESKGQAEEKLRSASAMESECAKKLAELNARIEGLNAEKEKISRAARSESRRIIAERTERAEEILAEIENIFKAEEVTQSDLIKARTLKNKMQQISFDDEDKKPTVNEYVQATKENLKVGASVFVKKLQSIGKVTSFNVSKGEAEVECGSMKLHCRIDGLLLTGEKKSERGKVRIVKNIPVSAPLLEINVLGMTVEEALYEVDNFIDKAVTDNLEEIKVIHGVGTGRLREAIARRLQKHRHVASFRAGKYGEGETGVTFIKIK